MVAVDGEWRECIAALDQVKNQTPFFKIMKIRITIFIFCLVVCAAAGFAVLALTRDMQTTTRGVVYGAPTAPTLVGVNVSLEQSNDADLVRALTMIRATGATLVRQHFYWNEIEPRPGEFAWAKWDRIVARARENNLQVVAVLDTTPPWARDPGATDLITAPPKQNDDYARFAAAFVARYGDRAPFVQIWDNPNVHPFWGRRNANPAEYTALLRTSALAIRAVNPQIKILAAGLAANAELVRGHPDFSDVLFLRGMYDAGAKDYFDVAAAKPYGMWSGAEDRRVATDVFNFSRAILLRDEMVAQGDAAKPMWAVEFGWNALPNDWRGAPSPWGTDTEAVQSTRLMQAIQRARSEWAWMPALIVQTFQPNVPSADPQWGFALADQNFQPRLAYTALKNSIATPTQPATFNFTRFDVIVGALALVVVTGLAGAVVSARQIPWSRGWHTVAAQFARVPELAQFALIAFVVVAFYYSPNVALNFILLVAVILLFALRLDLGLAITVWTIPFYLFPKNLIGGMQFSLVELLILAAGFAWFMRALVDCSLPITASGLRSVVYSLRSYDWAIIFFILLGLLSVKFAGNFGVASREFRVIVSEPALLYALIRVAHFSRRDLWRLMDAFVLSAVAIAVIGVYQYLFTNWVIVGEGVRRVLAVYGSPNNLALYLDRALLLLIALVLFVPDTRRRVVYALAALPVTAALYLTYSRGSELLAVPAGLLVIGLLSGKRARLAISALVIVGALALIPFAQTARFQSLFQTGTGTGFFRWSVWQSGVDMIRDHPVLGVGLDNFLYEYPHYIKPDAWREPNLSHPHNVILDFWVRLGVLGVVVLAWLGFEFYRTGWRKLAGGNRALVIGLLASMTAALAHGLIDASYFYVDLAYVFMLSFGVMQALGDS